MEEYTDINIWGSAGGRSTASDFGATLSGFQNRVRWSKNIDKGTKDTLLESIGSIREKLSQLDMQDPLRRTWEEKLDQEIRDIEQKGLDNTAAERLSWRVEQIEYS